MQITEALGRFLLQLEADGRSSHTIGQYRRHGLRLATWAARVGHTGDIAEFTPEDLAHFFVSPEARLTPEGAEKKPGSVNALRGSITGIFGFLLRRLGPPGPQQVSKAGDLRSVATSRAHPR